MTVVNDAVLVRYLIGLIISLYGAALFSWWWVRSGKASFVFMCVTLLFIGDTIEKIIQVYGRYMRVATGSVAFSESSVLWIVKGDISTLASLIVVVYLSLRIWGFVPHPAAFRREDHEGLCKGATGVIVHKMNGPVVYYRCMKCNKEFFEGDVGYDQAKHESERN